MVGIPHYFKLERDPFLNEGVEGLFFPGGQRAELLEDLCHHARYNSDLLAVCGEPGIGKTTILNALFDAAGDDTDVAAIDANPMMDERQFAAAVMQALNEVGDGSDALSALSYFLSHTDMCDRLLLILIDDAHNLPVETVLALQHFQLDHKNAFHLVFFIEHSDSWLDYLPDTVAIQTWQLQPYSHQQMLEYIAYRMETAGWQGKLPFNNQQLEDIFIRSGGIPSQVNQFSTDTLYECMQARSKGSIASRLPLIIGAAAGLTLFLLAIFWSNDDSFDNENLSNEKLAEGVVLREKNSGNMDTDADSGNEINSEAGEKKSNKKIVALASPLGSDADVYMNKEKSVDKTEHVVTSAAITSTTTNGRGLQASVSNAELSSVLSKDTGDLGHDVQEKTKEDIKQPTEKKPAVQKTIVEKKKMLSKPAPKISSSAPKPKRSPYTKSEQQLLASPKNHYVIQLVGMSDRKRLDKYISQLPKNIDIKTYQRKLNGKALHVAVSGEFANSAAAQKGIERLPLELRKQKPWAKQISSVHKEILSQ